MHHEAVKRLVRAVEDLPNSQRQAIRLRHLEGWSRREMASHFDRSEADVAGLRKRGLRKRRQSLRETDG